MQEWDYAGSASFPTRLMRLLLVVLSNNMNLPASRRKQAPRCWVWSGCEKGRRILNSFRRILIAACRRDWMKGVLGSEGKVPSAT